jgi:hypothetical protein
MQIEVGRIKDSAPHREAIARPAKQQLRTL